MPYAPRKTVIKVTSFEYFLAKHIKGIGVRKVLIALFWDIFKFFWKIVRAIYDKEISNAQDASLSISERTNAINMIPAAVTNFLKTYACAVWK